MRADDSGGEDCEVQEIVVVEVELGGIAAGADAGSRTVEDKDCDGLLEDCDGLHRLGCNCDRCEKRCNRKGCDAHRR